MTVTFTSSDPNNSNSVPSVTDGPFTSITLIRTSLQDQAGNEIAYYQSLYNLWVRDSNPLDNWDIITFN